MTIICDYCLKPIDRGSIDLGQQIQFAPEVDLHPDCRPAFLVAVQETVQKVKEEK